MIFPFSTYGVDFDILGQSHKAINDQSVLGVNYHFMDIFADLHLIMMYLHMDIL